jgi:hypothetical protein
MINSQWNYSHKNWTEELGPLRLLVTSSLGL